MKPERPAFNMLVICAIILAVVSLWLWVQVMGRGESLRVVFLDVGQGDATLITTPNGKNILVDTGPNNDIRRKLAPYFAVSDRRIDMVVLTHPDLDHIGGMLPLIDYYQIDSIIHSGLLAGAPIYTVIADRVKEEKIPTISAEVGQVIDLGDEISLEVYSPHSQLVSFEPNDYSVVMKLVYGEASILLPGDATKIIEHNLTESYSTQLQSDILKVGHHGSNTSSIESFVSAVQPKYGIISAGCDNRFGHPNGDVLTTLFSNGIEILDTCSEGDIVFESDGEAWILK